MLRTISGFVIAWLVTYIVGVIFISQGNLAQVQALGMPVDAGVRVEAALHDLAGMMATYFPLAGLALLIAFPIAALIIRFVPHLRLTGYMLAGFTALIAMHEIMEMVLGLAGVAPTRFLTGLVLQGVAGAIGGLVFHRVTRPSMGRQAQPAPA